MLGDNTYTRTFIRAIETLGSVERLAHALDASTEEIEAWAAGHVEPPPDMFLKAIDIVTQFQLPSSGAARS